MKEKLIAVYERKSTLWKNANGFYHAQDWTRMECKTFDFSEEINFVRNDGLKWIEHRGGKDQKDKAFCQRRIDEADRNIRGLKRNIAEYEGYKEEIKNGEIPKDKYGWELKNLTVEKIDAELDHWYEIMEHEIEKSVYYHECIENQGGISFSKENLNKGDLVQINRYRHSVVRIVRFGAKNVTFEFTEPHMKYADGSPMQGKCAYAEIEKVVKNA